MGWYVAMATEGALTGILAMQLGSNVPVLLRGALGLGSSHGDLTDVARQPGRRLRPHLAVQPTGGFGRGGAGGRFWRQKRPITVHLRRVRL